MCVKQASWQAECFLSKGPSQARSLVVGPSLPAGQGAQSGRPSWWQGEAAWQLSPQLLMNPCRTCRTVSGREAGLRRERGRQKQDHTGCRGAQLPVSCVWGSDVVKSQSAGLDGNESFWSYFQTSI